MSLDDKVNDKESEGFIKKAAKITWKLGMAAATTALSTAFVGTTGILVGSALAGGSLIGKLVKGKSLYDSVNESLTTYSSVNAVISPITWLGNVTYPLIPINTLAGIAARSLYAVTAYNAAFVGSFRGATHLIDNYMNPKGITKSITNNFYNEWKRIGSVFAPGYIMDALKISPFGIAPFALNAPFAGFYNAVKPFPVGKKSEQSAGYTPQYSPAPAH